MLIESNFPFRALRNILLVRNSIAKFWDLPEKISYEALNAAAET